MMPTFCSAIFCTVSPSHCMWSMSIGPMTAASAFSTLVASCRPPMPTSTMATSTGASANFQIAMAVSTSKKLIRGLPCSSIRASTRSTMSLIWSQESTKSSSLSSWPSMAMRSLMRSRCGEVYRPVRMPYARQIASAMRAVEPLPFVPVMWITRNDSSGWPNRSRMSVIRSRSIFVVLCSGGRRMMSRSTSRMVSLLRFGCSKDM